MLEPIPPRRPRRLLAGALAWLAVSGLPGCGGDARRLPPVTIRAPVLDIVDAFAAGRCRVLEEEAERPLDAYPAAFLDRSAALLESDRDARVLHARADSAFELTTDPLPRGALLEARTFVHSPARRDPEAADPWPVTFRILVGGVERAALSSAYVRDQGREHPYDQLMRVLEVDLSDREGEAVTLRFETTREGVAPPEGAPIAEPAWWSLELLADRVVTRQRASAEAPNLLVLCVDTLAAARTSLLGYERETTPHLTAAAARGLVFEAAWAPSSWTLPSTASLLTGVPPNTHGVLGDTRSYLMDALATWPEILRAQGLDGAAFVANPLIRTANNFDQGFGRWVQDNGADGTAGADAEALNAHLLEWLDAQPPGARWFAYVHYMDPHAPYGAPGAARDRFTGSFRPERNLGGHLPGRLQRGEMEPLTPDEQQQVIDLYDGEVAYFDRCFGELLEALAERGLDGETIVVVTADHGEELFEHGRLGHGYDLNEAMTAVPLVLFGPGIPQGRVDVPVGTASLFNTLVELGGGRPVPSAAPALHRPEVLARRDELVFATTRTALFGPERTLVSVRDGSGRKVIVEVGESGEAVDTRWLQVDGRGERPVEPVADDTSWRALVGEALAWHQTTAGARPPDVQPEIDLHGELRAVGYLGDEDGP